MANNIIVSFDLKAEFGFFKKPDINDIYITYNTLHKPALLGMLGAIIGLRGYQENGHIPQYLEALKHLKVGIQPLNSDKGNFTKSFIAYNNGTGFASSEAGGNLIITEQMLIKPAYRCFLLLDFSNVNDKKLYDNLKSNQAEFIPYMGKNDFSAWWDNFKEYETHTEFDFDTDYEVATIFAKTEAVSEYIVRSMNIFADNKSTWTFFEKLPIGFDEKLYQYVYSDFVFSNATFKKEMNMSANGTFYKIDNRFVIQLF